MITKEDLDEALAKAIAHKPRNSVVDDDTHATHHVYVQRLLEADERRAKRVERFKQSMIGTAATVVVGAIIWLGKVFIEGLKHIGGNQ